MSKYRERSTDISLRMRYVPIQPVFAPGYFSRDQTITPPNVHKQFYLSWEDALWHILQFRSIKRGSIILLPEFFCGDVVTNMEAHGLQCEFYPVDECLGTTSSELLEQISRTNPAIIVVFHAVGITNSLLESDIEWINKLAKKTILIEDCAHRIIEPEKVRFLTMNHYLIDSLRKVVPVQGSWLYSGSEIPKVSLVDSFSTFPYRSFVTFWWLLFQLGLLLGRWTSMRWAETFMIRGYDVIGDSYLPSPGSWFMQFISQHLDFAKIKKIKRDQYRWYVTHLRPVFAHSRFISIPVAEKDAGELRGFPVGIRMSHADEFLAYIRNNGLYLRFELNDSSWSTRQKIVYLPMGLNINNSDLDTIENLLTGYLNTTRL